MKAIFVNGSDPRLIPETRRPVTAVMSSPVTCVPGRTSLADASRTMVRGGLRHLAVLDDSGRYAGILSDRAIAAAWAADPGALAHLPAASTLGPNPAAVSVGAHVVDAARLMRTTGTDAVAVVTTDGAVVGIVTGTDLITLLAG